MLLRYSCSFDGLGKLSHEVIKGGTWTSSGSVKRAVSINSALIYRTVVTNVVINPLVWSVVAVFSLKGDVDVLAATSEEFHQTAVRLAYAVAQAVPPFSFVREGSIHPE